MRKQIYIKYLISLVLSFNILWQCAGSKATKTPYETGRFESRNILIDSTLADDPEIESLISPYRTELNEKMNVVIGHAGMQLDKGNPEAPLNNFIADLMLKRANREFDNEVHVAITNEGGLRTSIPKGPITIRNIYEVMPFDNELVVLEMTGTQLITLAEEIGEEHGEPVSGMRLEFLDNKLFQISVQNSPVDKEKIYYVTTTDYLSTPGRRSLKTLSEAHRTFLGITLRDAIIDEIKELDSENQKVMARVDGRIIFNRSVND
jgi:2',3'-cyclic-nucleotide 2'-phosphodiesterase (5'-nucleotidase family)